MYPNLTRNRRWWRAAGAALTGPALMLALAAAVARLWSPSPARAQDVVTYKVRPWGLTGLTRGFTARLAVFNAHSTENCGVLIKFIGNPDIIPSDRRTFQAFNLAPGQTAALELNGDLVVPRGATRVEVGAVSRVAHPPDPDLPNPCLASLQLVHNQSGVTTLQPPPENN